MLVALKKNIKVNLYPARLFKGESKFDWFQIGVMACTQPSSAPLLFRVTEIYVLAQSTFEKNIYKNKNKKLLGWVEKSRMFFFPKRFTPNENKKKKMTLLTGIESIKATNIWTHTTSSVYFCWFKKNKVEGVYNKCILLPKLLPSFNFFLKNKILSFLNFFNIHPLKLFIHIFFFQIISSSNGTFLFLFIISSVKFCVVKRKKKKSEEYIACL